MSHKIKSHHPKPFTGPVEFIPPPPKHIEFIDAHRLWGFPIQELNCFVLEENPERRDKNTLPPDQFILMYETGMVTLKGWRLELLVGPLAAGRIARIHAEKHLGALMIDEPWVSEIHVVVFDHLSLLEGRLGAPASPGKQP
jgi:hypothetical protein